VRIKETEVNEDGTKREKLTRYQTTVGRALLSEILPHGLPFEFINKALKKKEISKIINASFRRCGLRETVIFADKLMYNGFSMATRAGLSIAVDDMLVPMQKNDIIIEAEKEVQEIEKQYTSGLVTQGERYNKVVDIWGRAGDLVAKAMMEATGRRAGHRVGTEVKEWRARTDKKGSPVMQESFNSIYMMADSGARGFGGTDPPARWHARPDGQARWLDHRDRRYGELPRRSERACSTSSRPTARARVWPIPR